MPVKVSFECSQQLTDAQLSLFRSAIEMVVEHMVRVAKTPADVPEYFYTNLTQEEITE